MPYSEFICIQVMYCILILSSGNVRFFQRRCILRQVTVGEEIGALRSRDHSEL